MVNNRSTGSEYEQKAVDYLSKYNVRITERNFRNRFGEIDLIGYDGEYLVFFEVKYRKGTGSGFGEEAVNYKKQKTICKVADYYRVLHGVSDFSPIRFDVIAISGEEIRWIKDAFAYC